MTENNSSDVIDSFYDGRKPEKNAEEPRRQSLKKAKYKIFDEVEFSRGREVLGELIVHGMVTSGGTDLDWLIEHNGGFVIFEFKGFHNDKINIPKGQMIAYEKLHEKLNQVSKCFLYVVGCDDIDFINPDASVWVFEMVQWKNKAIPHNTRDIFEDDEERANHYVVYREYMEEIRVDELRKLIDSHWKEFEQLSH